MNRYKKQRDLVRVQTYMVLSPKLKKGITLEQIWPSGDEVETESVKEKYERLANKGKKELNKIHGGRKSENKNRG